MAKPVGASEMTDIDRIIAAARHDARTVGSGDVRALCDELDRLRDRHADIVGSLYGQGFEVLGWHLNGDTEPLDNWFENNDWIDTPDNTQESQV